MKNNDGHKNKDKFTVEQQCIMYNNNFSSCGKKGFFANEVGAQKANESFNTLQCNQVTTQLYN